MSFLYPAYKKISQIVLTLVLVYWSITIMQNFPKNLKETANSIDDFFGLENKMQKIYSKPQGKLTPDEARYRIINEKYWGFLKNNFSKNYEQIAREIFQVDFKHQITKAAYFIKAQKPPQGTVILMFSAVDWMDDWPSSKFFEYQWVNIAPASNKSDATAKDNKFYKPENEILEHIKKYNPKFILAVFVFKKVIQISGYELIYFGDVQQGGSLVYKKLS